MSNIWNNIANSDQSVSVLNEIFGVNLHTMLSKTEPTTLFAWTINYFNVGLLSLVFVIYAFIIIIGTINTARDGQFLGKNWSGHWISIRAIMGTLCAIPLKSGYCIAQYLIFSMIIAGVSFADYVWQNVTKEVDLHGVPPVLSSEVTNQIKGYLAQFMMSAFTIDMLQSNIFVTSDNISNDSPCHKNGNNLACKVEFSTQVTNSFLSEYQNPISDVLPFKNYASNIAQGLTSWSTVTNDDYVQFEMNKAQWYGIFDVDISKYHAKGNINRFISYYGLTNANFLKNNLFEQPNAINNIPSNAIILLSNQIIKKLQTKNLSPNVTSANTNDTSMFGNSTTCQNDNSICYDASINGWWNADKIYLQFDNSLSNNLQNLYRNLSQLSATADSNLNQIIKVSYNSIVLSYYENKVAISDLLPPNDPPNVTFKSLNNTYLKNATIKLTDDYKNINKTGSFTTSLGSTRKEFNKIIKQSGITTYNYKGKQINLTDSINSLLSDTMELKYANYIYMISSLVKSSYTSNPSKAQAQILVKRVILPVIELFKFFQSNHISFSIDKTKTDTSGITDPAEVLLSNIFSQIGSNSSTAEVGSLLSKIYKIGSVPDNIKDKNFAAKNFSMIQNVQAVGMALIEGTINSMIGIFSHAKDQLQQIQNSAKQQFGEAEDHAKGYAAANAFTLGLFGSTFSAQTNLEFAKVMFNVTMQLATFSLSLMWLPLVIFVLGSVFSIGISFSLVIPLTPYILFWAGKTAWLLLVIEAMIAAPFVSLGLVYPEGHEVFGKAEPGIQICMNLILRPVFMVLGMIFAIGLTYIVIQYSAEGFHTITDSLLNLMPASDGSDAASYARGTFSCMIIFMYATFLSMAFMKCFSLIYVIPDKVLQWIGNTRGERAGEAEIQEFKGAAQSYSQSAGQAGGQTMSQGIDAEKSYASSYVQGQKEQSQASAQRNLSASTDAGSTAKQAGEAALML
ncbi:DotA/TraY family protein [Thiotrichales bacterium 19S3-7]|nr:DotA/TraY family protein [Thiotrichales bacterium 19S3-7]MCF6800879.1 DotA/TraY family protein [Thiotrichales bacterium 19S3-11]